MNENAIDVIRASDGTYRRWTGRQWLIYSETRCNECGKKLLRSKQDLKRFTQFFCCERCKNINAQKTNDPKAANLLENRTSNFYYLIGLISTDGWVQRLRKHDHAGNGYLIIIQLQKNDIDLLYGLQRHFGGIVSCIGTKYSKWSVYHFYFNEYLKNEVKLSDNKSFTLNIDEWFNTLSVAQKRSFMRGVIDGDGCIYFDKRNGKRHGDHHVNVTSASFEFVKTVFKYFAPHDPHVAVYCKISDKIKYRHTLRDLSTYTPHEGDYYTIGICSKKTINFLRELYGEVDDNLDLLHMKRKREKYLKIKEYYELRSV